jgi:ABC-type bacteriocin/lantibiotic exporter with double-glycine peptidase domain
MLRFPILLFFALLWASAAPAKIDLYQGLVPFDEVPAPVQSNDRVILAVPQRSQLMEPWCVTASVSMVLAYYGRDLSPAQVKQVAEDWKHPALRNVWVTSWLDMQEGLKRIGEDWEIRTYPKTRAGFSKGMREIKRSLRRGRPVLIDVDLLTGHTFVVAGYDDRKEVVYIRDPLLKDGRMRVLSYATLLQDWHNRRLARTRSAFFSKP